MKNKTDSIFCSHCGTGNQTANAYCKRCGEWLPKINSQGRPAFGGQTPQQNLFTSLFMSALSAVVALISAIALYATHLGTVANWSVYLAAAFCICIAAWQLSSFLVGLKLRRRLMQGRTNLELESQSSSPALPANNGSNFIKASVTENTTELLQPVKRPKDTKPVP